MTYAKNIRKELNDAVKGQTANIKKSKRKHLEKLLAYNFMANNGKHWWVK